MQLSLISLHTTIIVLGYEGLFSLSLENLRVLSMPAYKNVGSNPYNYILSKAVSDQSVEIREYSLLEAFLLRFDIIHVHWPEWYLNSHYYLKALSYSVIFVISLMWCRLFGKKIVWTIHNLAPHKVKYPFLNKWFWKVYLRQVDGTISLSHANQKLALSTYPALINAKNAVTYHGLYKDFYPKSSSSSEARVKLGLPATKIIFLFLGQIKKYKRPELLVEIFKNSGIDNAVLVMAGKFEDDSFKQDIRAKIGNDPSIILHDGFVSDDELQYYYASADFSVIPFGSIFNSGSALLSVSYNVPVILPFSKNFEEYDGLLDNSFYLYKGDIDKSIITCALNEHSSAELDLRCSDQLEWSYIANKTKEFYLSLRT